MGLRIRLGRLRIGAFIRRNFDNAYNLRALRPWGFVPMSESTAKSVWLHMGFIVITFTLVRRERNETPAETAGANPTP